MAEMNVSEALVDSQVPGALERGFENWDHFDVRKILGG